MTITQRSQQAVPAVDGVLTAADVQATGKSIAALQFDNGQIPWFPGGHTDPWNHIENAMALDTVGLHAEAVAAYRWLADIQHDDGSWHQYYLGADVEQPRFDANTIAYIAVGVWHHWLITHDRSWLDEMWPVVDRAIEWVLALQRSTGDIVWARHPDGTPYAFSLLTGSSSMFHSIKTAATISDELGHDRSHWSDAAARLGACIRDTPEVFAPKERWAMDWYYPVLTGVLQGDDALARLRAGESKFVSPDKGVRCVADQDWYTSAETCEAVMAYLAADDRDTALALFRSAQINRDADGAYFTGKAFPAAVHFPGGERSTYTAAAIVLAADALSETTPASRLLWAGP